jgi:hypothetical protein
VSVCGTVGYIHRFLDFSSQYFHRNQPPKRQPFIRGPLDHLDGYNHEPAPAIMPRIQKQYVAGTGILTRCPSPTLIRLGLGPTNPGVIIMAQETLLFRWEGFSPSLWLLIPAFSLDNAPRLPYSAASMRYQRSSTAPHQTNPMQSPYLR